MGSPSKLCRVITNFSYFLFFPSVRPFTYAFHSRLKCKHRLVSYQSLNVAYFSVQIWYTISFIFTLIFYPCAVLLIVCVCFFWFFFLDDLSAV